MLFVRSTSTADEKPTAQYVPPKHWVTRPGKTKNKLTIIINNEKNAGDQLTVGPKTQR